MESAVGRKGGAQGFEKQVLEEEEIRVRLYRALTEEKETRTERNGRWQQSRLRTSWGKKLKIKGSPQKWR